MPIEGFDVKKFAQDLANQSKDLVPQDLEKFQKDYIVKTLYNFSNMAGDAISNDKDANFDVNQAIFLTQIIAEWSFHKSIDVIRSGIQPEYWDGVLQKVAFTIYDICKQAIIKDLPQNNILELVEHHVKKSYEEALQELKQRGIIDEQELEFAEKQNNLNQMMEEIAEQQAQEQPAQQDMQAPVQDERQLPQVQQSGELQMPQGNERHSFKLASLAMLLKTMAQDKVSSILNKVDQQDAQMIIQYMQMPDLDHMINSNIAVQYLKEIKASLPEKTLTNPYQIMYRIRYALQNATSENLETMFGKERLEVRRFIAGSLENEYYELPPKIANVIAQHVESIV